MKYSIDPCLRIKISIYLIFGAFGLCGITQFLCAVVPGVQLYLELVSVLSIVFVLVIGISYFLYASRQYQISQGWISKDDPFTL